MLARIATIIVALAVAGGAHAQDKKRIDKAADLPRFSYKVGGKLDAIVRDDAKFRVFAQELRRDTESVLAQFQRVMAAGVTTRTDSPQPRPSRSEQLAQIAELPFVRRAMELFDVEPGKIRYTPSEGEGRA